MSYCTKDHLIHSGRRLKVGTDDQDATFAIECGDHRRRVQHGILQSLVETDFPTEGSQSLVGWQLGILTNG